MSKIRSWWGRKPMQECPICGAAQPLSAHTCSICGAVLPGKRTPLVPPPSVTASPARPEPFPPLGEDDLYVGDLKGRMWRLLLVGGVVLGIALGVGIGIAIGRANSSAATSGGPHVEAQPLPPTVTPASQGSPLPPTPTPLPSPTRPMALLLPTVTPAPPTATPTPTPGPCYQTAAEGDTVLAMAMRCGHRDMAVIDLILELNGMDSPQELQLGQTLEIPWPTPTPNTSGETSLQLQQPAEPLDELVGTGGGAPPTEEVVYNAFGTPDALAYYRNLEPTLRPGLAWHTVQAGETIMGIAYMYDTSVETLSQLNPEVPFLQCDFGERYGGPNCSVILIEGQRIRVPVPIPTVTPTWTPNGTFTPTPTATATYNAPYLLSPEEGAHFMADQIVTLRWGSTGTLAPEARYVVRVTDLEKGEQYMALTSALSYTLPEGWQPADGQTHTFQWTVSVATVDAQGLIVEEVFITAPRLFLWDGR